MQLSGYGQMPALLKCGDRKNLPLPYDLCRLWDYLLWLRCICYMSLHVIMSTQCVTGGGTVWRVHDDPLHRRLSDADLMETSLTDSEKVYSFRNGDSRAAFLLV